MISGLKSRLLGKDGGNDKSLPVEVSHKKAQVMKFVSGLKRARQAVVLWMDMLNKFSSMHLYYRNNLADAVEYHFALPEEDLHGEFRSDKEVQQLLQAAIKSLSNKIKFVESLEKQYDDLETRFHARNRVQRKISGKKTPSAKELEALESAEWAYRQLLAELLSAFDFLVKESHQNGGIGLASKEMSTLQNSQLVFFMSCSRTVQQQRGLLSQDVMPEMTINEWEDFASRRDMFIMTRKSEYLCEEFEAVGIKRLSNNSNTSKRSSNVSISDHIAKLTLSPPSSPPSPTSSFVAKALKAPSMIQEEQCDDEDQPITVDNDDDEEEEEVKVSSPMATSKPTVLMTTIINSTDMETLHRDLDERDAALAQELSMNRFDHLRASPETIKQRIDVAFEIGPCDHDETWITYIDRDTGDEFFVNHQLNLLTSTMNNI